MDEIICIGECQVDFYCTNISEGLVGGSVFEKKADKGPANVAKVIAQLGGKSRVIAKIGVDAFGDYLEQALIKQNLSTEWVIRDERYQTSLSFTAINDSGENEKLYFRGADQHLSFTEIPQGILFEAKGIHFGSATALLGGSLKVCYHKCLQYAHFHNKWISFDPNYCETLWEEEHHFRQSVMPFIGMSQFIKLSEDELYLITEADCLVSGIEILMERTSGIIAIPLIKGGIFIGCSGKTQLIPCESVGGEETDRIEDVFVGAFIQRLFQYPVEDFMKLKWTEITEIAKEAQNLSMKVCDKSEENNSHRGENGHETAGND